MHNSIYKNMTYNKMLEDVSNGFNGIESRKEVSYRFFSF